MWTLACRLLYVRMCKTIQTEYSKRQNQTLSFYIKVLFSILDKLMVSYQSLTIVHDQCLHISVGELHGQLQTRIFDERVDWDVYNYQFQISRQYHTLCFMTLRVLAFTCRNLDWCIMIVYVKTIWTSLANATFINTTPAEVIRPND